MANQEHLKILKGTTSAWNRWRKENPEEQPDLTNADLKDYYSLSGADLSDANLCGADLFGVDLTNADLANADLTNANLYTAVLLNADLTGADLTGANLDADPEADQFDHLFSDLTDANIDGDRTSANLYITDLSSINLEDGSDASFLDLATCKGIEHAVFPTPHFLPDYLCRAFVYAHRQETREVRQWPRFVSTVLKRIRALQALYSDSEPPLEIIDVTHEISAELIQYLARHPGALYEIKPRQFEEFIAEILASYGWEVNLTPATRDGGYDLFAISKDKAGVRTSWLVECKKNREDRKVGIDVVRALYGVKVDLRVANMMLATTSYFSRDVHDYKASRYDLELRDYEGVLEWLNEYRPNPNGRLYIKDNRLVVPGEEG